MAKILGSTTTYHGDEHPYLRGLKVRIVAVMKRAATPDYDPDRDGSYLRDGDAIARAGGVTAEDRIEVQELRDQRPARVGPRLLQETRKGGQREVTTEPRRRGWFAPAQPRRREP